MKLEDRVVVVKSDRYADALFNKSQDLILLLRGTNLLDCGMGELAAVGCRLKRLRDETERVMEVIMTLQKFEAEREAISVDDPESQARMGASGGH